ncbi:MAG: nucleotidyl transferase AbiEii/AbiGii toxin family protein [Acidobacteriota bacterium]|nr:nucleotidyl transferase AbiEii/AbiGii toxin family protein [Acidobacteriota bacterium]
MFEQIINRRTALLIDTLVKSTAIAEDFYLSGGTALAFHLGHRISEDLDSFCALTKIYDDLSLTIAGDFIGDSFMGRNEIKEMFFRRIEELKQNTICNVSYAGVVKGDEKVNLMQDSDIFILPTYFRSELFPLAITEALRAGNVIITTRHNFSVGDCFRR